MSKSWFCLAQVFDRLKAVYKDDLSSLDLWPAGLLETTPDGPGPVFSAIILDQFRRIRKADRFWYENYELNKWVDMVLVRWSPMKINLHRGAI